jgi:hypothetical protein
MSKQPFKENYVDDGGFEYMPSEQGSEIHDEPPRLTPVKTHHQQSLVYSASSHNTDLNSPQFGVVSPPK